MGNTFKKISSEQENIIRNNYGKITKTRVARLAGISYPTFLKNCLRMGLVDEYPDSEFTTSGNFSWNDWKLNDSMFKEI